MTSFVRESLLVELVSETGTPIGEATVADAHTAPGRLHRAFSVHLLDTSGRLLLQQRAAVKTRFPLRWANACCGHPSPGMTVVDAALARLAEELGVTADVSLTEVGVHLYRADDPDTGLVEHEYDHVLLGIVDDLPLRPDPAEVHAVRWVDPGDLRTAMAASPTQYAPWLPGVTALALP
ncbi:MAG: isopentenyl-diphosphate Delta-isomerase [Hamadaea sp.]|uniref:isopentenyl-diphosphate Delta-isomerase n=1 Tax=Hamadaea sp. TaxID=2024425 RepID=UPI0017EEBFCC|nr:isopentenyl-diphosphate Delta-isomerase [Hamadaea sp.]NUR74601.1 isopentenyl-diphosphate Delta-isomerase [Hamadaea sp.]NUT17617.1 isopentenyl-diphosphate Delta-isomerase [Hamadaea sp.]